MNDEKDTMPTMQTLLDAINGWRQETNARFERLENNVNARLEQMRLQMMSFDVRIDRVEAATHEVLNIAINVRADVKVLREEVYAWSTDVRELQKARREAETLA